jgi:hypothetical protein
VQHGGLRWKEWSEYLITFRNRQKIVDLPDMCNFERVAKVSDLPEMGARPPEKTASSISGSAD